MRTFKLVNRNIISVLPIVLMAAVGAPPQAYADDAKNFPASTCAHIDIDPFFNSVKYGWIGEVMNNDGGELAYVNCPIERDNNSGFIKSASVRVVDRHNNQNFNCSLATAAYSGGGFLWWADSRNSDGSTANAQLLSFLQPPMPSYLRSNAHYFINCGIPPVYSGASSFIVSYYAVEP